MTGTFSLAGVLLSHPFEVARVIIQHNGSQSGAKVESARKIIRSIYAQEGVAGLYRGVVPRTLTMTPAMVALVAMSLDSQPLRE